MKASLMALIFMVAITTSRADEPITNITHTATNNCASNIYWLASSSTMTNTMACDIDLMLKQIESSKQTKELVEKLAETGAICKVLGHKWEFGCSVGAGCLVYHSSPIRHCLICGTEQSKSVSEWK